MQLTKLWNDNRELLSGIVMSLSRLHDLNPADSHRLRSYLLVSLLQGPLNCFEISLEISSWLFEKNVRCDMLRLTCRV